MNARNDRALSVRSKILLTVGASIVLLSALIYLISSEVLLKSYLAIEREGMVEDLRRANDAIEEFENQQMIKLSDWAAWDEAYEYGRDRNDEWVEETIYASGMANLDINVAMFTDTEGNIFHLKVADIETREEVASSTVASFFESRKDLVRHAELDASTRGIVMTPDGPLIVVSLPLRTSEGLGPIPGSITFARFLDEQKITDIADITHLSIEVLPYEGNLPEEFAVAKEAIAKGAENYVVPKDASTITGYVPLLDIDGSPVLLIRVDTPRPIFEQGQLTFFLFTLIGGLAILLFGIVMVWLLDRLVIARFVKLTRDVERINRDQDLSTRVEGGVMDDIGKLAGKINQMLSWLSESRHEIEALLEDVKHGKERAEEMVVQRTQELADEKARLLASINSLSFGFVIADTEDRILLQNPALGVILSFTNTPETTGGIAKELARYPDASDFDLLAFCASAVTERAPKELKVFSYGKKFLRFFATPVASEDDGEVIGYVLIIEDVTEAKVAERSREEFFSIASHELRTPLTAISGNAGMLLHQYADKLPEGEMRGMLEDIDASSKRLISIVNDFLEVSRLEQGKIAIKKEAFDLGEVIASVSRTLTELATEKNLTLTVEAGNLPQVLGDKNRTEQVLLNLVGNALKFTEKGGVTVRADADGSGVTVRVTDTGVGISEHNQTRLFRKFQQAGEDMLARDVSQSTGLGLYISKLIISAMNGTIGLEQSEAGKGSTFYFTLPKA